MDAKGKRNRRSGGDIVHGDQVGRDKVETHAPAEVVGHSPTVTLPKTSPSVPRWLHIPATIIGAVAAVLAIYSYFSRSTPPRPTPTVTVAQPASSSLLPQPSPVTPLKYSPDLRLFLKSYQLTAFPLRGCRLPHH